VMGVETAKVDMLEAGICAADGDDAGLDRRAGSTSASRAQAPIRDERLLVAARRTALDGRLRAHGRAPDLPLVQRQAVCRTRCR